jgi:hypothetical protein
VTKDLMEPEAMLTVPCARLRLISETGGRIRSGGNAFIGTGMRVSPFPRGLLDRAAGGLQNTREIDILPAFGLTKRPKSASITGLRVVGR